MNQAFEEAVASGQSFQTFMDGLRQDLRQWEQEQVEEALLKEQKPLAILKGKRHNAQITAQS